ncbi:MAG: NAD(P)-dependent oxidoreductase [Solirubrobacterales bacterium]|nr:NAD(P)-dependent oxidoreductase [Solirubrobacterales bacterium]
MQLGGQTIAVTGAGGFIGEALCRRLSAEGSQVVGIDVRAERRADVEATGARFVASDVLDEGAITAALGGCDGLIHTAAIVGDWGSMEQFIEVNVRGSRTVFDAAEAAKIKQIAHLSSVASWGYEFSSDLEEEAAPRASGAPYADTKAASDYLALRRGAAVVRPGDVYGPGSVPWAIRPIEALRAGTFALPGKGDALMTLVYIDDLVDCILRALTTPEAAGQAVTAWDGVPITTLDFFGCYAQMLGQKKVRTAPAPIIEAFAFAAESFARLRGTQPSISREAIRYVSRQAVYPNTRARELLGWEPQVDFDEGMRRTERWLRAEGLLD